MLVRVLKAHSNGYGENYSKAVGDVYDHPSPASLIVRNKLEGADGSGRQIARLSGTRKEAGSRPAKSNSEERIAKGGKGRARTNGGRRRGKGA